MSINISTGFTVGDGSPIDIRTVVADEAARLALAGNAHEGIIVYQLDTNTLHVLRDATAPAAPASWDVVGGGDSIPSVTSLSTTAATANELVSLTSVDGTNAIGYYFRVNGATTWTSVGGASYPSITEDDYFPEFQTTVTFNSGGSRTVLIIDPAISSDFSINAGNYELVSVNGDVLATEIDVVSQAILANGTFREVVLAGAVPVGVLNVGANTAVFRRDVGAFASSQVNIVSERVLVSGELDLTGLDTSNPNRDGATYSKNGFVAVSGLTAESIPDWSGLLSYEVNDEVSFRNNIYKRRTTDIVATTGVSIVPGFTTLVSFKNNVGITGALGYADTFTFDQENVAAPALNNGVAYRFTIGAGSTQYVVDADPGSTDVTANVGTLYGNGLQSPATSAGRIWQLRLLTPTGTIAPGYTIISVGDTVYTSAQQPAAQTALIALLATKPDGTAIDNLDDGDQISFGGSPNTAPSEDVSWELISNATLASSRYDLIEGELISFHQIPNGSTTASLNENDVQRTLFEGRVIGLSTIQFDALGDRTLTDGTQAITLPNGMAELFPVGTWATGRGASFSGIFTGQSVTKLAGDATEAIRIRITSLRQDNSEAIVALDDTTVVPGLGTITRPGDIIQIARLENVVEIEDPVQLPAGFPVRFQSRVATSGTLLPFASAETSANQDIFVEYYARSTYDFVGTIAQSSTNIDQLAVTVVGTTNEIGSVHGEIHSDLIGYVIHENGDTYFLANPTRVGLTDVYNFDVVSVGGGNFAELFRDETTAVTWEGEHTIYLATEVEPFVNLTNAEVARWDAAAARTPLEIIETHSTVGLTSLTVGAPDTLFSFAPRTTDGTNNVDAGIRISFNNTSVVPSVVLRIADTHSILSMNVSDDDISDLRVGDRYFFSDGSTFALGHIITDTEADSTHGFGRYQAAETGNIVHLYLDDVASNVVANIGTVGVDRFSINRHNQNIETEYGWFFQSQTVNGITYSTTSVDAFRFYAIDTTDQFIFKLGTQEVTAEHVNGVLLGGVIVQEEGTSLPVPAQTINFTGSGVIATGTGDTKTIAINGGSIIPEHNTIPVTSDGTSNPNDLVGWELEISNSVATGHSNFLAVNGTSTSRIDLTLIDAHPRLRITFANGDVAMATIVGSSHSTVTTTQLIGRFDVPRADTPAGSPEIVTIRYYGDDVPASYIASPLTINANDEVIYNGNELATVNDVASASGVIPDGSTIPVTDGGITPVDLNDWNILITGVAPNLNFTARQNTGSTDDADITNLLGGDRLVVTFNDGEVAEGLVDNIVPTPVGPTFIFGTFTTVTAQATGVNIDATVRYFDGVAATAYTASPLTVNSNGEVNVSGGLTLASTINSIPNGVLGKVGLFLGTAAAATTTTVGTFTNTPVTSYTTDGVAWYYFSGLRLTSGAITDTAAAGETLGMWSNHATADTTITTTINFNLIG